jgi:hypothetical protein
MDLAKEARALESLTKLVNAANECRVLFDEAGMDYPAPLRRMLGEGEIAGHGPGNGGPPRLRINPPASASRPAGVPDGWICVPLKELLAQTVALGVLRAASEPLPTRSVTAAIRDRGLDVSEGSVANIGTRLEKDGVIRRSREGWSLANVAKAPILNGSYAWGSLDVFMPQELAARRREAIIHVLSHFGNGLQTAQILTQLAGCSWLRTPLSKDMLKMDMEDLQKEGRVRRGALKKWMVAEGNKA